VESGSAAALHELQSQHSSTLEHLELTEAAFSQPADREALLTAADPSRLRSLVLPAQAGMGAVTALLFQEQPGQDLQPRFSALGALDLTGNAASWEWQSPAALPVLRLLRTLCLDTRSRNPALPNPEEEDLRYLPQGTDAALAPATRLHSLELICPWNATLAGVLDAVMGVHHLR